MAHSQSIEHRIAAYRNSLRGQPSSIWHGRSQQTDTADKHQFAALSGGEGKSPDPAHILDADHFRCKNIWNANRIDELHDSPQSLYVNGEVCAPGQRTSMVLPSASGALVNQSFQEVFS